MIPFLIAGLALAAPPAASPSAASTASIVASDTTPAAAAELFAALDGRWECAGAFADGRRLEADLAFEADLGGRTLRYRHVDRAPNQYVQTATWGIDPAARRLVSLAFATVGPAAPAEPALFVASRWTARSVTVEADTLLAPPWAPNRFTYSLERADSLRMVWEVEREGSWRMGDYLECRRGDDG